MINENVLKEKLFFRQQQTKALYNFYFYNSLYR